MQAAPDLTVKISFRLTPPWSRLIDRPASGSIQRSIKKSISLGPDNDRFEVRILGPRGCTRCTSKGSVREDDVSAGRYGNLVPSPRPSSKDIGRTPYTSTCNGTSLSPWLSLSRKVSPARSTVRQGPAVIDVISLHQNQDEFEHTARFSDV